MRVNINTPYPDKAGIYKLTCNISGKLYIGKSVNLRKRLTYYEKYSNTSITDNSILKRAILKYGWNSFSVELLEIYDNVDNAALLSKEKYYIQLFDATDKNIGYNICKSSTDRTGIKHSCETKQKMRNAKLGKKLSEAHKNNISISTVGKQISEDTKKKMSISQIGNRNAKGHSLVHSEETKEKISESHKGKKLSEETKEKIRQSRLGRKHDEITKQKIRQSTKSAKSSENKAELRSSA